MLTGRVIESFAGTKKLECCAEATAEMQSWRERSSEQEYRMVFVAAEFYSN